MPYEQDQDDYPPRGHSRGRSGKGSGSGSNDLTKARGAKPLSQKAMLSRALQKANTAVQLDNAQNFEGARQAYAEACDLLQQVLQRTTADEDKRKLEAIRRTYTSRIDELDQMGPWQAAGTKALPARPESQIHRRGSVLDLDDDAPETPDEPPLIQTATLTRVVRDDSRSPLPPQTRPPPPPQRQPEAHYNRDRVQDATRPLRQSPEHGLLQSAFSRSPVRLRSPIPPQPQETRDHHYMPPPLSPFRPSSPPNTRVGGGDEGPVRSDFSLPADTRSESRQTPNHVREDSQNSWLDPIDESGGSSGSSVHSRTSSLGYRRKHIRHASGNTVAEFDTALDAAIEAAYDEGYEPVDHERFDANEPGEEIIANALRKVEIARERVRQTELEAYGIAGERERLVQRQLPQQQRQHTEDFYDDNSSDEEERMLEEMTRGYAIEDFAMDDIQTHPSIPRESDSSGMTTRTWHSSTGSNPTTGTTPLSTVTEVVPLMNATKSPAPNTPLPPPPPPPAQAPPDLPQQHPASAAQSVRNRRLSGQNTKQLKIETAKLVPSTVQPADDVSRSTSAVSGSQAQGSTSHSGQKAQPSQVPRPDISPEEDAISPLDERPLASPFGHRGRDDGEDDHTQEGRSASPSTTKLHKNFSSSSLRSMKSRNMSISNLDDASDMSPGTPSTNHFGGARAPAVPALPTPMAAAFREKLDTTTTGLFLFDDNFHSPNSPGSPNPLSLDAPVSLEPCPTDFMLRPFWLMRCLYQTLAHPRGGYLSTKLFVPRDVWRVKGVKLKNIEEKVSNCDFLTAALLKLAKVDTFDADAVLEEMQALEGVLEQTQAALTRKLGNEVGVQGSGTLFKDASNTMDGDGVASVPRSASVSNKSSSFSWRRLRSKNSAVALGGSFNSRSGSAADGNPEAAGLPTLPMTANPTSRPVKRDLGQLQFMGPNAQYMASLARLFDAAQAIDQIARQVEDPGLRHADKTQVGLELCTRHAAEFFGFYICRFVLADLGMLLDKFIKRGSEWVLA